MPVRTSEAVWEGSLKEGRGRMMFGGGAFEGAYSFASRFEEGSGTNPEELIAAAHAGCYSMALSHRLASAGFTPKRVHTAARVHLEKGESGFEIARIDLKTDAEVPGIDRDTFLQHAEEAKRGCPVSRALAAVDISLEARLVS
ncbi:MAG: OsmC family protein [Gemmatimonadetes bacterium]|nr:OsmC family protein [Gemmatimonadota bacterium]